MRNFCKRHVYFCTSPSSCIDRSLHESLTVKSRQLPKKARTSDAALLDALETWTQSVGSPNPSTANSRTEGSCRSEAPNRNVFESTPTESAASTKTRCCFIKRKKTRKM